MAEATKVITERQQYWLDHIQAAAASDGTMAEYAARHELKVGVLYEWKRKLRRLGLLPGKAPEAGFVPVAATARSSACCSIALPNGVRLQLTGDLDATTLGQLLFAAHSLP